MKITIFGRPISKKNSKRIIKLKGRTMLIPSTQYRTFERDALRQLSELRRETFTTPVSVIYIFYMKGMLNADGDNLEAGINDILEKAGILKNDSLIESWHGMKKRGCPEWKTEVVISPLKSPIDSL